MGGLLAQSQLLKTIHILQYKMICLNYLVLFSLYLPEINLSAHNGKNKNHQHFVMLTV